jgi:hypothetical protein
MKPSSFRISICLGVTAIILAVSCTKKVPPPSGGSGGGTPNPSNGNFVSLIKNTSGGVTTTDSFKYDNSKRLTSIIVLNGQTSTTTFTYSGSATFPSSYTVENSLVPNNPENHQLWYDGQNRIVKDSTLSGGNLGGTNSNAGNVTYYSYPSGMIATLSVGKNGAAGGQVIDTFFLSNGNVVSAHLLSIGAAGDPQGTVSESIQVTYNSIVNPQFHQAVSSTWGPLLTTLGGYDAVSGYAENTATTWTTVPGLPTIKSTDTASWTVDGKGRGATEVVTDDKGLVVDNFAFTYF